MKYTITAHHCNGESVSHPCSKGVFEDPTDSFEDVVEAESQDAAEKIGYALLFAQAQASPACDCRRKERAGSNAWCNSVAVLATPAIAKAEGR